MAKQQNRRERRERRERKQPAATTIFAQTQRAARAGHQAKHTSAQAPAADSSLDAGGDPSYTFESLDLLHDRDPLEGATDDPIEAAQEGLTYVPPNHASIALDGREDDDRASRFEPDAAVDLNADSAR